MKSRAGRSNRIGFKKVHLVFFSLIFSLIGLENVKNMMPLASSS
jgi:hypothetical protein